MRLVCLYYVTLMRNHVKLYIRSGWAAKRKTGERRTAACPLCRRSARPQRRGASRGTAARLGSAAAFAGGASVERLRLDGPMGTVEPAQLLLCVMGKRVQISVSEKCRLFLMNCHTGEDLLSFLQSADSVIVETIKSRSLSGQCYQWDWTDAMNN